ncbi:MAG: MarR family transcriptional regulator [Burkholderiaceae bacterium]
MTERSVYERFGIGLGQLSRLWRKELDRRLSPHGLTEARWLALLHLSRMAQPVTQKDLAIRIGVQGPTLVRTLDWLEAEGLIERHPIADDRRAKALRLTDRAMPSLARIQAVAEDLREEIFAEVDHAEILTCLAVFERLGERLGVAALQERPSSPTPDAPLHDE